MNDDDLDLSAVAADAALLDALAAGSPDHLADDQALAGLAALRTALDDDLLIENAPAPRQAAPVGDVVALRRPSRRRTGGRAAVLVAGALALSSTGVAAATYDARPGDPFYGLRTAVAGPRAEDPDLLRERLDAVQQQLRSPDAATRSAAREELAEVDALLSELEPGLRGELEQRHATLVERLAESRPEDPPGDAPAGPPAGAPTGPPAGTPGPKADKPSQGRTPDSRPEPTGGPTSTPPAQRPTTTPEPAQDRPSPQATRPSPRGSASPPSQRPSPRGSQGAPPSRSPRAGQSDRPDSTDKGKPAPAPSGELTAPD